MIKVKSRHIPIFIELLLLGAKETYIQVSTTSLANKIDKSQQAASRHLLELEDIGYIKRKRSGGKNKTRDKRNYKMYTF